MSIKHALSALLLVTSAAHAQVRMDEGRVVLPSFAIDRTEVTIAQFERYVQATGTVTRAEKEGGGFEYGAGWERRPGWSWRKPDGQTTRADMPAVHLDFAEAQAYCRWAGGRLPTGDEWQKAGFTELRDAPPAPWTKGRTYPWTTGDTPQGANTSDPDPWPRAAPAGATRQGVNGLYDMGANVWEWTTDSTDATDATGRERRTVGGSWWYGAFNMKADVCMTAEGALQLQGFPHPISCIRVVGGVNQL